MITEKRVLSQTKPAHVYQLYRSRQIGPACKPQFPHSQADCESDEVMGSRDHDGAESRFVQVFRKLRYRAVRTSKEEPQETFM